MHSIILLDTKTRRWKKVLLTLLAPTSFPKSLRAAKILVQIFIYLFLPTSQPVYCQLDAVFDAIDKK